MRGPDHDPKSHTCFLDIKDELKVNWCKTLGNWRQKCLNCNFILHRPEASIKLDYWSCQLCKSLSNCLTRIPKRKVRHNNFFDYLSKCLCFFFLRNLFALRLWSHLKIKFLRNLPRINRQRRKKNVFTQIYSWNIFDGGNLVAEASGKLKSY